MRIGVLGAGGWGTTLANLLANSGHEVTLWARDRGRADEISQLRENKKYLPGITLSPGLTVTSERLPLRACELFVLAIPSQSTREVVTSLRDDLLSSPQALYVNTSKGVERRSLCRITEVLTDVLKLGSERMLCLSGPSHAEEVARGMPTAVVVSGEDRASSEVVQNAFLCPTFRVYTSHDVVGVELCGALKNVIAVCAGIIDGVGYGDNTKAALITRGLAEMRRLGIALGAEEHTFAGLAGLGDLVVTCASKHSRNRFVGEEIGKGRKLDEILSSMSMVAEGIWTAQSANELALRHKIEMPIVHKTFEVLFENKDPREATEELMTRVAKHERENIS